MDKRTHQLLRYRVVGAVTLLVALTAASPFIPPSQSMSREDIQRIIREEVSKGGKPAAQPSGPTAPQIGRPPPGVPYLGPSLSSLPQQPGAPLGVSTAATGAQTAGGPVDELLREGGRFIGCAGDIPVFTDKDGRRAYFTTKELDRSVAPRRFARCKARG